MKKIIEFLNEQGYAPIEIGKQTALYEQYYVGKVDKFHEYEEMQGAEMGMAKRTRASLGMAKVVCERWADNMINPETTLNILSDEEKNTYQEWLDDYLEDNDVIARLNDFIERVFAQGLGATVQLRTDYGVVNQYLEKDSILPLKVFNGQIIDCAFITQLEDNTTQIQVHQRNKDGYEIINYYIDEEGDIDLSKYDEVKDTFNSPVQLFQIYRPAIVNNATEYNWEGISIFGNALSELQAVDLAFDGMIKEVKNGRMRVYVQGSALVMHKGKEVPIFNSDQDEFYQLPEDAKNPDGTFINVQAPTLRIQELIDNLNKQLNLLGTKVGFGENAFYSDQGSIYTNTEQVVSSNSIFFKTRTKHATLIGNALTKMVYALYYLTFGKELNEIVDVNFDDSIIHDKQGEFDRAVVLHNLGLISQVEFFVRTEGMTEEEAKLFVGEQIKSKELPEYTELDEVAEV